MVAHHVLLVHDLVPGINGLLLDRLDLDGGGKRGGLDEALGADRCRVAARAGERLQCHAAGGFLDLVVGEADSDTAFGRRSHRADDRVR